MATLEQTVLCARCAGVLEFPGLEIVCARCGQRYPRVGRIAVLLPRPDDHVSIWRQQLALLIARAGSIVTSEATIEARKSA